MKKITSHTARLPRLTGGYLMLLALVFCAIFITVIGALAGYAVLRDKAANAAYSRSEALALAEGGLARYAWTLTHAPDALYTGDDRVSIEAIPSTQCGTTTSVSVRATGTPADGNGMQTIVSIRFVRQPAIEDPCPEDSASSTPAVPAYWGSADWKQE